jgi:hypothetical protein
MRAIPGGLAASALGFSLAGVPAMGQTVAGGYEEPTLDRWMYPFNSTPGSEPLGKTFGAIQITGFDDRDGQFLLGFDTSRIVTPGLALEAYRVQSLTLRATVGVGDHARYDPTWDSVTTLYADGDPTQTPDADAGKPVEIFGVGYRNNWTSLTFGEFSPFSQVGGFPQEGTRNCFAAEIDADGNVVRDISRQVRQRFEAYPMAVGVTSAVMPGELMPAPTELTFRVDLCSTGARRYIQRGLQQGKLMFMVTSLAPAQGGPGGGTGDVIYPEFYTRENAIAVVLGAQPKLDFVVNLGRLADVNGDGGVTIDDLLQYLQSYSDGVLEADVTDDCGVTIDDLLVYLEAYERG